MRNIFVEDLREENEREKAKFQAKPKEKLSEGKELIFKGCILRQLTVKTVEINMMNPGHIGKYRR